MNKKFSLYYILFLLLLTNASATTWDEPWMDKVIKDSDSFVLAVVTASEQDTALSIKILKTLSGRQLPDSVIRITNFSLLELCSTSGGHGPEFHFEDVDSCYFFLKVNERNEFEIATPTTGFAVISNNKVMATYRHSYHQTMISQEIYEKTMTAIFQYYHNIDYDKKYIHDFITANLSLPPAGFSKDEIDVFFNQHVAVESIYHLRLDNYYSKLIPFLHDTSNRHNQISAARALIAYNTKDSKAELLRIISDTTYDNFVQVMCIWTLQQFKPKELRKQLEIIEKTALEKENGFGGNIMDPRVCTSIPTVRTAINELLKEI